MAVPPVSLVLDLFIFFVLNFLFYDARVKIICLYKLCLLYENCLFHPNIFMVLVNNCVGRWVLATLGYSVYGTSRLHQHIC